MLGRTVLRSASWALPRQCARVASVLPAPSWQATCRSNRPSSRPFGDSAQSDADDAAPVSMTDLNQLLELYEQREIAAQEERKILQGEMQRLTEEMDRLAASMEADGVGFRMWRDLDDHKSEQTSHQDDSASAYRPDIKMALQQPAHVCELGHQALAELAVHGNHAARRERLLREIMKTDNCTWEEAHEVLFAMDEHNEKFYWLESMPYRLGIFFAFVAGVAGTLLVFYSPVAVPFAKDIVGEDEPEELADLTVNQVGIWTWQWMEPLIGTASFVLLCLQFSRAQLVKMNMNTWGDVVLNYRAYRLAKTFPRYDASICSAWAKHMPRVNITMFPTYERRFGIKGVRSGL